VTFGYYIYDIIYYRVIRGDSLKQRESSLERHFLFRYKPEAVIYKDPEQPAFLNMCACVYFPLLVSSCLVSRHQSQPEYMFTFKVRFSQSTVKMPGCDLILPLYPGCIRGDLCGLWRADIPECISPATGNSSGGENKLLTVDFL